MDPDQRLQQLEDQLARLQESLESELVAERRAARAARIAACTIGLIVAGFVLFNYVHLRSEWTGQRLTASLEREIGELNPVASHELQELAKHLLPIYADQSKRQLHQMTPTIVRALEQQLHHFGDDLREDVHDKLQALDRRLRDRTAELIFEAYPDLQSEDERQELDDSFHEITEDALITALSDFDARFSEDAQELQEVVTGFDLQDTGQSAVDLQRQFIHLWLKLIDMEVMKP